MGVAVEQWRAAIGCYAQPGPHRERLVLLTEEDSDDLADPDNPTQSFTSKRFNPSKLIIFTLIIMSLPVSVGAFTMPSTTPLPLPSYHSAVPVGASAISMTDERQSMTDERRSMRAERRSMTAEPWSMTDERQSMTAESRSIAAERRSMAAERRSKTVHSACLIFMFFIIVMYPG